MTATARHPPPDSSPTVSPSDEPESDGRIVWHRLLQRKLLLRVTIPTVIGLVQLVLALMAVFSGSARPVVLLSIVPALLIGFAFGRGTQVTWDDDRTQVALLRAQVLLAVSYVVVRIGSHILLEQTLRGRVNDLATILLLVSSGLFIGRTIGLSVQIRRALVSRSSQGSPEPHPQ